MSQQFSIELSKQSIGKIIIKEQMVSTNRLYPALTLYQYRGQLYSPRGQKMKLGTLIDLHDSYSCLYFVDPISNNRKLHFGLPYSWVIHQLSILVRNRLPWYAFSPTNYKRYNRAENGILVEASSQNSTEERRDRENIKELHDISRLRGKT